MANEASAALSDAYGHVMHGDDAGSSAKLVWVVHPTKVPIDITLGDAGGVGSAKQAAIVGGDGGTGGAQSSSAVGSPGRNGNKTVPSSYLFTQKFGE